MQCLHKCLDCAASCGCWCRQDPLDAVREAGGGHSQGPVGQDTPQPHSACGGCAFQRCKGQRPWQAEAPEEVVGLIYNSYNLLCELSHSQGLGRLLGLEVWQLGLPQVTSTRSKNLASSQSCMPCSPARTSKMPITSCLSLAEQLMCTCMDHWEVEQLQSCKCLIPAAYSHQRIFTLQPPLLTPHRR